jgi:hypothetical protein
MQETLLPTEVWLTQKQIQSETREYFREVLRER